MPELMRLQKWLADAGLCSRREGEQWITDGRVTVNGQVVIQLGSTVGDHDKVAVDGHTVYPKREDVTILLLHKPPGILCTRKDPENRRTVFDLLSNPPATANTNPPVPSRLICVGRLDYNSEGLILFTNNGSIAHGLMHPSNQVPRTYRVRVHGRVDDPMLAKLRAGVLLEEGPTGPLQVELDYVPGANSWLTLTLAEGRNRMIRRIFEAMGMEVSRLIRVSYGSCTLGDLPREQWRSLQPEEMTRLLTHIAGGIDIPIPQTDHTARPSARSSARPSTPGRRSASPMTTASQTQYPDTRRSRTTRKTTGSDTKRFRPEGQLTTSDTRRFKPEGQTAQCDTRNVRPARKTTGSDTKRFRPEGQATTSDTRRFKPEGQTTRCAIKNFRPTRKTIESDTRGPRPDWKPCETETRNTRPARITTENDTRRTRPTEKIGGAETRYNKPFRPTDRTETRKSRPPEKTGGVETKYRPFGPTDRTETRKSRPPEKTNGVETKYKPVRPTDRTETRKSRPPEKTGGVETKYKPVRPTDRTATSGTRRPRPSGEAVATKTRQFRSTGRIAEK